MKNKSFTRMLLATGLLLLFAMPACAVMTSVWFDGMTTTYPDAKELGCWVKIEDSELKNPPDFVKTVFIDAPDGSRFFLTTDDHWQPVYGWYWATFRAEDFDSGTIPGGVYAVTVKDKTGTIIRTIDGVAAKFLDPPIITNPMDGQVNVEQDLTIRWDAPDAARWYRIQLYNADNNEPVYGVSVRKAYTYKRFFKLLSGDLKPNTRYKLRVEARLYPSQDLDQRSRTDYIEFQTADW